MNSHDHGARPAKSEIYVLKHSGIWKAAACLTALLTISSIGIGAEPDLRVVNAEADRDPAAVRTLLKQGVDVNSARGDGSTALLWAAHWNDLEMVDLLLRAGAKVDAADDLGVTPLIQAAENTNLPMVGRLLKASANANLAQASGMTPLMTAAHTGNLSVVQVLLAHGANVNASTTETKSTALMWAVSDKFPEIAKVLIGARADVHVSTSRGFTPLIYAAHNGDIEMAKILVAAGVKPNEKGADGTHPLVYAIAAGQVDFAMFLLDQGADPNATMDGVGALHAASGGVSYWLSDWTRRHDGGNNYLSGGGFGSRGLDPASSVELIKALLSHGADPNQRIAHSAMFMRYVGAPTKGAFETYSCGTGDIRGATPLWVAAYAANGGGGFAGPGAGRGGRMGRGGGGSARTASISDVLLALLAGGAKVDLPTDDGTTPLMVAAGLGRPTFVPGLRRGGRSMSGEEAVKVLVEAGANVNAVNEADFTPLHGAAFRGLNEIIQYLVERGADINARDFRGRTPYRLAEGSKQSFQFQAYPETAAFLKQLGADTRLGIPGTVQERLRDVPAVSEQHAQEQ
jgi:ankyrin repeat protein